MVIYPSPVDFQPITFIQTFDNTSSSYVTMEEVNLPYMYSSSISNTAITLTELPLTPTSSTNLTVPFDPEYPQCSVPLELVENYYIGRYIENMSTGEFREITDFIVTTTDVVLQIGQINSYLAFNTDTKIVAQSMSSLNSSLRPLSDIAYYYQGVVVRLTSGNAIGQESVVCDYTIDPITGLPNLTLLSPFSAIPQVGDTFQLVSTRNYYAVIASPFSVALPSIPIYSEALRTTENTAGYEVETILSLN